MIIRSSFWNIHQTSKVNVSFSSEVTPSRWLISVFENILIKFFVLCFSNFVLVFQPKRLVFVHSFIFIVPWLLSCCSIDWILNVFFSELFSLFFPFCLKSCLLSFNLRFSFFYFLFEEVLFSQINWVIDETWIFLDEFL